MLVLSAKLCNFTDFHGNCKAFLNRNGILNVNNMKEKVSTLFSQYIIDGMQSDATPFELLSECMEYPAAESFPAEEFADIVDESIDPPVTSFRYDNQHFADYMNEICSFNEERKFRMLYPDTFTRQRIAYALIDMIWNKGHYKLGNLNLLAQWEWNTRPVGNMAAFYRSVQAASEYIYDLGCRIEEFSVIESDEESIARFAAVMREEEHEEEAIKASPYESRHPWIEDDRQCSDTLIPRNDTQVIYIPFDTAGFKLGGSLFAELKGHNGGASPHIMDPDYFIDCYEVVREMVEDGIIMAGVTVGDGGLAGSLSRICKDCGIEISISGISSSYMEEDGMKILFSEVPGVLIQVSDYNMDYIDSQLLLQDVAYYILGSPSTDKKGLSVMEGKRATVAGILASLITQASEGED